MKKWFKRIGVVIITTLVLGLTVLISIRIYRRADPSGYVASYALFNHDPCDVLSFTEGKVMLRTCCGDEDWGTYFRSSEDVWIWRETRQVKNKEVTLQEHIIQPHAFSVTFIDSKDSSKSITLNRRIFLTIPF